MTNNVIKNSCAVQYSWIKSLSAHKTAPEKISCTKQTIMGKWNLFVYLWLIECGIQMIWLYANIKISYSVTTSQSWSCFLHVWARGTLFAPSRNYSSTNSTICLPLMIFLQVMQSTHNYICLQQSYFIWNVARSYAFQWGWFYLRIWLNFTFLENENTYQL